MSVQMKAVKSFANTRITGPRTTGAVLPGETFSTDWLHAKQLAQSGLAEAVDANDLAVEPTDAVQPTSGLSAPQLAAVNKRRADAATKVK